MRRKVLLVGEGPCDIGDLAKEPAYREGREGFLQPLLRAMAGGAAELDFDGRKLTHLPKKPMGKPRAGKLQAENASQSLALASALGASALVLAFDTDKASGTPARRVERQKRLRELRASAEAGFAHAREGDPDAAAIHTAVAIPCRMIEAWALGDRAALARLLGVRPAALDYREPEDLWGDEGDPESSHPKCVWQRVTEDRVDFAQIGAAAAPAALARACPDSFPPFAADIDRALGASAQRAAKPARPRRRTR